MGWNKMTGKRTNIAVALIEVVIMLVSVCMLSMGCQTNLRENIHISQSQSERFTSKEIDSAINCVIIYFNFSFTGCKLTDLWYDESKSDSEAQDYLKFGGGSEKGIDEKNIIVLLSNFDVDASGGDGSLEPDSTYTDWNWILIRKDKNSPWILDDWGYG
jgi:hypothetical protein